MTNYIVKLLFINYYTIRFSKSSFVNQTTTFTDKVTPEKTVNVTSILKLPKKGGHRLEATLFEEDKEMDRG